MRNIKLTIEYDGTSYFGWQKQPIGNTIQQKVDMVINIGALKDKNYDLVERDIKAVVDAANKEALVKVIIETCYLTDEEKKIACELAVKAGTDYVKTSTGFGTSFYYNLDRKSVV